VTDVDKLPRVGGTDAGGYYEVAPDVLIAYPREHYIQDESDARASLTEMYRIARDRGRCVVTVVLVDRVKNQDSDARRVWKDEIDSDLIAGLALVAESMLGRAIVSFFIGLTRPRVPTVMVATVEDAVEWANKILSERGALKGPADSIDD